MNQSQALYRLQVVESSIDAAKSRVSQIEKALEKDESVQRCEETLQTCQTTLHDAQLAAQRLEHELESLKNKIQEGEALLYGGGIKNPRELKDRQAENESLKKQQSNLETEVLNAQEALAKAKNAHETATTALQEAKTTSLATQKELTQERDKTRTQMSEWLANRKDLLKILDANTYQTYKQLKPQKKGIAVARLDDDDLCTFCRVEQTQVISHQVRQGKLIPCNNCGRILVAI